MTVIGTLRKWTLGWKLKCPQKIRLFVWLLLHERLPFNTYICHIGIPCSNSCDRCEDDEETILHLLWDCPASHVWEALLPRSLCTRFFTISYDASMCRNIKDREGLSRLVDIDWSILFLVAIWLIWKAIN